MRNEYTNASVTIRNLLTSAALAVFVASGMIALGCSGNPQKTGGIVVDSGALAICVLQHSTEPISKIVEACGGATETLVTTILSEHRAAAQRELSSRLDGGK